MKWSIGESSSGVGHKLTRPAGVIAHQFLNWNLKSSERTVVENTSVLGNLWMDGGCLWMTSAVKALGVDDDFTS